MQMQKEVNLIRTTKLYKSVWSQESLNEKKKGGSQEMAVMVRR